MNRVPTLEFLAKRLLLCAAAMLLSACDVAASQSSDKQTDVSRVYQLEYLVTPDPDNGGTWVEMKLAQTSDLLREVNMRAPADRISQPGGDGEISHVDDRLIWKPPARGGSLRWFAAIDHQRVSGS